jgi:hypothetical protein
MNKRRVKKVSKVPAKKNSNLNNKSSKATLKKSDVMPRKVSIAIKLLWIVLAIGLLRSFLEFPISLEIAASEGFGAGFVIAVTVISIAVLAFFIIMIAQRRNWARIVYLVFFLIGLPFGLIALIETLSLSPFSGVLGIGQIVIDLFAMIFLFQKPSSDWFKSR